MCLRENLFGLIINKNSNRIVGKNMNSLGCALIPLQCVNLTKLKQPTQNDNAGYSLGSFRIQANNMD